MGAIAALKTNESTEKTMPSEVTRLYGNENKIGLFSYYPKDIISMCTSGGSPFMRWLPARAVNTWHEPVAHLSWVAPEGFDGSTTYGDYLAALDPIAECDYGDGYTYQICEYAHKMDRVAVSTQKEPLKPEYLGMKRWEQQPSYVLRGENEGLTLSNDIDWSLSRLAAGLEQHLNWTALYGNPAGYVNTYLGLLSMLVPGWVAQHKFGGGSCDFTDPLVINGVGSSTPETVLRNIRGVVRKLRARMAERNYTPKGDDMVVVMGPTMWQYVADAIAFGSLVTYGAPSGMEISTSPEAIQRERDRITQGGIGFGYIPIDGIAVPVVPETLLEFNTTTAGGDPAVTGDILVLTKNFRGIRILEHQYLDWSQMRPESPFAEGLTNGESRPALFQGNMIRVNPVRVNGLDSCWYYGAEMYGRIATYMQPLQARITSVTLETDPGHDIEAGSFAHPNFYAFNGGVAGGGTAVLAAPIAP
jgi:hypothetical protein